MSMVRGALLRYGRQSRQFKTIKNNVYMPSWLTCDLCKFGISLVQNKLRTNETTDAIADDVVKICIDLNIESVRVCRDVVSEFKDWFCAVITNLIVSPDEMCGLMLGPLCAKPYNPFDEWNITFPDVPKPPVVPPSPPKLFSPTHRVLHLSDIHYDKHYRAGSNANCGEPICCRRDDGRPAPGDDGAGKWGDLRNCDAPLWLLDNLFQHLSSREKFHYVLWTGDLPAHDIWEQTKEEQLQILHIITQMAKKYLGNVPVFPAVGNHESAPANNFPQPFITGNHSIEWLYDALADTWIDQTHWLPPYTRHTIKKGGYYTVLISPGLRLVALNSMYGYYGNFWLYLNTTDPAGQLQWLISILQTAEDNEEKVYIIGHIPPGIDDCLRRWSWNYYKIINRYESTVVGQFFGHTHFDHFQIFYDEETLSRPLNVAYIAGSVTTQPTMHPSYRIYETDGFYLGSTRMVLNHHTYILNITDANLTNKPVWIKEYSAKEAYGMNWLFPNDWNSLVKEFKKNKELFNKYYTYYYKSHPVTECDDFCRKTMICDMQSGRSFDPELCNL
ncbi:sphingomyelin phosphodiesterase-like [Saccoglossus kowalevskii]